MNHYQRPAQPTLVVLTRSFSPNSNPLLSAGLSLCIPVLTHLTSLRPSDDSDCLRHVHRQYPEVIPRDPPDQSLLLRLGMRV